MQNGFQNNDLQNNGFQSNGFQNNGFQNNGFQNNGFGYNGSGGFDVEKFLSDSNMRKVRAIVGIARGAVFAGVCGLAISSPMFKIMESQGVNEISAFALGFIVLLILLIIVGVVSAVRNLITLILIMTGKDTEGFGMKYIVAMGYIEANTGRMVQIVMGAIFVVFSVFSFIKGPGMMADQSSVTGLYIVTGVFVVAGLGLAIGGTVGIIKSIRNYFIETGIQ